MRTALCLNVLSLVVASARHIPRHKWDGEEAQSIASVLKRMVMMVPTSDSVGKSNLALRTCFQSLLSFRCCFWFVEFAVWAYYVIELHILSRGNIGDFQLRLANSEIPHPRLFAKVSFCLDCFNSVLCSIQYWPKLKKVDFLGRFPFEEQDNFLKQTGDGNYLRRALNRFQGDQLQNDDGKQDCVPPPGPIHLAIHAHEGTHNAKSLRGAPDPKGASDMQDNARRLFAEDPGGDRSLAGGFSVPDDAAAAEVEQHIKALSDDLLKVVRPGCVRVFFMLRQSLQSSCCPMCSSFRCP